MDDGRGPAHRRRGRVREWLARYLPAELAGILGAVLAAGVFHRFDIAAATAYAGAIGETVAFYSVILFREVRAGARRADGRSIASRLRGLVLEFGPAELLDTFAIRPLAMYLGSQLIGSVTLGVVAGKIAADVVFYTIAVVGYEASKALAAREAAEPVVPMAPNMASSLVSSTWIDPLDRPDDPLAPEALDQLPHRTPYLLIDLDRVEAAYLNLAATLGADQIHYAMKCNPDMRVLATLHRLGCGFEIASYPELARLLAIGVDGSAVLYSNPVKPIDHIRAAYRAGCRRFAVDGRAELRKLAEHAPGSNVYVRLRCRTAGPSGVPSEGKFGVDGRLAVELLRESVALGLHPYGLTFHVGSQMTRPSAWAEAIDAAGAVMADLDEIGIRLRMLDVGGGFPARYGAAVPQPHEYGELIKRAVDRLPYRPLIVAEPGRALVGEAGVLVAGVIGSAERDGRHWVHLDVGAFNGMMEALETGNTLRYPVADSLHQPPVTSQLTGPTCDSQDTLLFDVALSPGLTDGDRVYIGTAGAYTLAYASSFNGFEPPLTRYVSSRLDAFPARSVSVTELS
jgi:ornithine decarboxylase